MGVAVVDMDELMPESCCSQISATYTLAKFFFVLALAKEEHVILWYWSWAAVYIKEATDLRETMRTLHFSIFV